MRIFCLTLFSGLLQASQLNIQEISNCEAAYKNCLHEGYNSTNATLYYSSFEPCSNKFDTCMDKNAYIPTPKPLACYKAEAAWRNVRFVIFGIVGISIGSFIIFPIFFKAIAYHVNWANGVNFITNKDPHTGEYSTKVDIAGPDEYKPAPRWGTFLRMLFDANRDGVIEVQEIVSPLNPRVLMVGASGFGIGTTFQSYHDAQAACDYELAKAPK